MDWVSEQPEFAKFLITARFNIIEGGTAATCTKNKSRNQKIFSLISNFEEFKAFSLIPHELLLSLVIGSTESYCRAWLSQRVKLTLKTIEILAKAAWNSLQDSVLRSCLINCPTLWGQIKECGFRLKNELFKLD